MAGNVVRISKVVIRLNEPCLQAAQSVASLAGVNLSELVEILLLGLVDEGAVLDPGVRHAPEAAAPPASIVPAVCRRGRPAKVISMEDARARRRVAATPVTPLLHTSQTLCERAARVRENAQAASARALAARQSAERVRQRAARAVARPSAGVSGFGSV